MRWSGGKDSGYRGQRLYRRRGVLRVGTGRHRKRRGVVKGVSSSVGKTVVVTGATSGIGEVAARVLAERGARVFVVARNEEKAKATVSSIRERTGNEDVDYLLCDFASQKQIRDLATTFQKKYDRLDVLVNNAGAFFATRGEASGGLERTWAVNHLGYFLLTRLLLDTLQRSAPARIVNVASNAHQRAEIHFEDVNLAKNYSGWRAYGQSKLANIMFTYALARRLEGTGVTVNALHPGFVATNIGANSIPVVGSLIKRVINLTAGKTPEEGAETVAYLAASPEVEGVTGEYFVDCKPVASSPVSYDENAQEKLWELSERAIGGQG